MEFVDQLSTRNLEKYKRLLKCQSSSLDIPDFFADFCVFQIRSCEHARHLFSFSNKVKYSHFPLPKRILKWENIIKFTASITKLKKIVALFTFFDPNLIDLNVAFCLSYTSKSLFF